MSFGARLECLAQMLPSPMRIADIGTDHAYLPVLLANKGMVVKAVAGDIVIGPCEAARRTVDKYNYGELITVRQGNGLAVVEPGEVDAVFIAGMGGKTIAEILEQKPLVVEQLKCLVLQPMNEAEHLRKYLAEHGWKLVREELVQEGGKIYAVILAMQGVEPTHSEVEYEVGPLILTNKSLLLEAYLQELVKRYSLLLEQMGRSEAAVNSAKYQGFQQRKEELEGLLCHK